LKVIQVKKSTERKRIKRMRTDARLLFVHGLITAPTVTSFNKALSTAEKKL
jgi:hypothetical protein|tara:strand:- start:70 stop:222 length:153 start_codon:yes stop_codon:yes gene_type:complete